MKILKKIRYIKHYVAAYRLKREEQRRRELLYDYYERQAFDYLTDWENNKDNSALLFLRNEN